MKKSELYYIVINPVDIIDTLESKFVFDLKNTKSNSWILANNIKNIKMWLIYILNQNEMFAKEIKISALNKILTQRTGLGTTGESYLVDENNILRSESRFINSFKNSIYVETKSFYEAINGKSGSHIIKDYRNVLVFSSYIPFVFLNKKCVIISEIDYDEAMVSVYKLRNELFVVTLLVMLGAIFITIKVSEIFTKPIKELNLVIKEMSKGKLPVLSITKIGTNELDEIKESVMFLAEGLKKTAVFANNIGNGDLTQSYKILSKDDVLGLADVVIMDVSMPKMSGIEALQIVVQKHTEVAVIMLSMHEEPEYLLQSIQAGASSYLSKNVEKEELILAIQKVAKGEKYINNLSAILLSQGLTNLKKQKREEILITAREKEVLEEVINGMSNKQIANKLFLSIRTIETHRNNLLKKFNSHNTAELIKNALKAKI